MRFFRKKWVLAIVLLAVFGMCRLPLEAALRKRLIETRLLQPPPAKSALSAMSQSVFMGTLGGMRSLVAFYLSLKAHDHFSHTEWSELDSTYKLITNLEPSEPFHWENWIWHIGINAVANVELYSDHLIDFERDKLRMDYLKKAAEIGERAMKQHPRSAKIRHQLADVYREKLKDYCKAAELYKEMIGMPDAMGYTERFHYYFLAQCPGKEQEAYDGLIRLYQNENNRTASLIHWIKVLEDKLEIPFAKWIPDPNPDDVIRRQIQSGEPLPGGLKLPGS